ncbi:hypothetical protein Pmar_PMAR016819, partial [Perkinsus marinus ATCC 50983]
VRYGQSCYTRSNHYNIYEVIINYYYCQRHLIIIVITSSFNRYVDFSTVYHYIRGQSMMKLYVMFNTLETLERLVRHLGSAFSDTMLVRALATTTTTTSGDNSNDDNIKHDDTTLHDAGGLLL